MRVIPKEQVKQRLIADNSWWETGAVRPIFSDCSPRAYFRLFYPLAAKSKARRAVVLMGPRRVGKTYMIHHAIAGMLEDGVEPKRICYFRVDHPIYMGLGLEQMLQQYQDATGVDFSAEPCHVFFDEIQYLKNWELHLKALVDGYPDMRCVVSGSAAAALKMKSQESGAGRFTNFLLPPLTFHEYLELAGKMDLVRMLESKDIDFREDGLNCTATDLDKLNEEFVKYLNFGGYPEVIFSEEVQADPGRFIKSDIIDKVLLRDLPGLYGIQDIQELNYLFSTLAFNTAGEVSLEGLSQNSGVAKNTLKRYIEYLEAAFLVKVVNRIDISAKKFKRANFFKVYLTNPSIRSALFSTIDAENEAMGAMVETAVFSQWFHSDAATRHYARWKNGEVDLVNLGTDGKADWAVDAKWSDHHFDRVGELKSAIRFCHANNLDSFLVTTRTRRGKRTFENIEFEFIPASEYCFTVGYNLVKYKGIPE
jgi:hypothetical protein